MGLERICTQNLDLTREGAFLYDSSIKEQNRAEGPPQDLNRSYPWIQILSLSVFGLWAKNVTSAGNISTVPEKDLYVMGGLSLIGAGIYAIRAVYRDLIR